MERDRAIIKNYAMNIATFHLTVRQNDPLHLPEHSGSMLRGAFGHALRELSCVTELPDCTQCPLNQQCRYTHIFETQLIKTAQNSQQSSNPYMLRLPKQRTHTIRPNQTWSFGITLVGSAIKDYTLILKAWQQAIAFGLDNQGNRATGELIKVSNQTLTLLSVERPAQSLITPDWQIRRIPAIEPIAHLSKITLHFLIPFRLQYQGKIAFYPHQFEPKQLLVNLYNRIQQCNQQHDPNADWQTQFSNFAEFIATLDKLTLESDVSSVNVRRSSSRQNRKIDLFGLTGDVHLSADSDTLNRLLPLLWLGQYLHIGKNTTLGLGQYQLQLR